MGKGKGEWGRELLVFFEGGGSTSSIDWTK
jgi:hypothetical protein